MQLQYVYVYIHCITQELRLRAQRRLRKSLLYCQIKTKSKVLPEVSRMGPKRASQEDNWYNRYRRFLSNQSGSSSGRALHYRIICLGNEANEISELLTEVGKLNQAFPVHLKYLFVFISWSKRKSTYEWVDIRLFHNSPFCSWWSSSQVKGCAKWMEFQWCAFLKLCRSWLFKSSLVLTFSEVYLCL